MMKNINAKIVLYGILMAVVVYVNVQYMLNFGYTPELGIYYTGHYSFALGDGIINYIDTNLNLFEILGIIWNITF